MLTHIGIYRCCNCKKQLDLINTTVSIFLCCQKQFATCIQCARISCPKCNKQRIKRVNKNILNGLIVREKKQSMFRDDRDKKEEQQSVMKVGRGQKQTISETSPKDDTKYPHHLSNINNNNNINNSQKNNSSNNNHSTKEQQKRHCIICEIAIQQSIQKTNQSKQQQQLAICKICELMNQRMLKQYNQPTKWVVVCQQQKERQRTKQQQQQQYNKKNMGDNDNKHKQLQKSQKSQKSCVICQRLLQGNNQVLSNITCDNENNHEQSTMIRLCLLCKQLNEQTQRQFAISKQVRNNNDSDGDKLYKQTKNNQSKMSQCANGNSRNISLSKRQQLKQQQQQQQIQYNYKFIKQNLNTNQYNHITMTTIQKSRKQDQLDMGRKYSIDEAEQQLIQVEVQLFVDGDKNRNNELKRQLRQCQKCNYLLLENDGLWYCHDSGKMQIGCQLQFVGKNTNRIIQDENKQNYQKLKLQQYSRIFLCMLCANNTLLLTTNSISNSNIKKDRQIFIY